MNWLNKLERKFGRFGISNLTMYLRAGYVIGFGNHHLMPQLIGLDYAGTGADPERTDMETDILGTDTADNEYNISVVFSTFYTILLAQL